MKTITENMFDDTFMILIDAMSPLYNKESAKDYAKDNWALLSEPKRNLYRHVFGSGAKHNITHSKEGAILARQENSGLQD